jgi:iron(III) transport system ATP-binding protein
MGNGWKGAVHAGAPYGAGESVTVMIRPENLRIGAAEDGQISWSGRVSQSIYRGAQRSITVDPAGPGGGGLRVEAPALERISVGDTVQLSVAPGGAWAIRS